MAYFNHAFVKCFNPSTAEENAGVATKDLAAGKVIEQQEKRNHLAVKELNLAKLKWLITVLK